MRIVALLWELEAVVDLWLCHHKPPAIAASRMTVTSAAAISFLLLFGGCAGGIAGIGLEGNCGNGLIMFVAGGWAGSDWPIGSLFIIHRLYVRVFAKS